MSLLKKLVKPGRKKVTGRDFVAQFPYRPDDVVIASYPKSGSTWLRFIISHLQARKTEVDFLTVQHAVPEISPHAVEKGVDYQTLPSPRFMRTHAEFVAECPRVIYMLRDGRDVMVSFYFHHQKFENFDGTLLDFLKDERRLEWDRHVESWLFQNPHLDRMCVIRYEQLMADPAGGVAKIAAFGGLKCSPAEIRRAVEESSFERMKAVEKKKGLGYSDPGRPEIAFVRKGGSGNWRELFGDAEKKVFKERFGRMLIKTGYESSLQW
jgi:hypothetical protein